MNHLALPDETLLEIIKLAIADDNDALVALSLCSRQFRRLAGPILFEHLTINGTKLSDLGSIFGHLRWVTKVTLRDFYLPATSKNGLEDRAILCQRLLENCSNVTEVELGRGMQDSSTGCCAYSKAALKPLETFANLVTLVDSGCRKLSTICPVLLTVKVMNNLRGDSCIAGPYWDTPNPSFLAKILPHLESLSMGPDFPPHRILFNYRDIFEALSSIKIDFLDYAGLLLLLTVSPPPNESVNYDLSFDTNIALSWIVHLSYAPVVTGSIPISTLSMHLTLHIHWNCVKVGVGDKTVQLYFQPPMDDVNAIITQLIKRSRASQVKCTAFLSGSYLTATKRKLARRVERLSSFETEENGADLATASKRGALQSAIDNCIVEKNRLQAAAQRMGLDVGEVLRTMIGVDANFEWEVAFLDTVED